MYRIPDIEEARAQYNENSTECYSVNEAKYRLFNHVYLAHNMLKRGSSLRDFVAAIKNGRATGAALMPTSGDNENFYHNIRDRIAKKLHEEIVAYIKKSKVLSLYADEKDGCLKIKVIYERMFQSILKHYSYVELI